MILSPFFLDEPLPELESLATSGWQINRPELPAGPKQLRLSAIHRPLAELTAATIRKDERPVSIAGDCCTAIGVLAGLQRAGIAPTLVWFDAHGDFNTWETTPSGFLGGMPLAMLVGRGEQTMLKALNLRPLPEKNVMLTDARNLDPQERDLVENAEITHMSNVTALLHHPLPDGPLYIHLDTDIVNPHEAPAMNYPAPGGPSVDELRSVMKRLHQAANLAAVSMSTWNPNLDHDGQSRTICMQLLATLIDG
jgi:arginase